MKDKLISYTEYQKAKQRLDQHYKYFDFKQWFADHPKPTLVVRLLGFLSWLMVKKSQQTLDIYMRELLNLRSKYLKYTRGLENITYTDVWWLSKTNFFNEFDNYRDFGICAKSIGSPT